MIITVIACICSAIAGYLYGDVRGTANGFFKGVALTLNEVAIESKEIAEKAYKSMQESYKDYVDGKNV